MNRFKTTFLAVIILLLASRVCAQITMGVGASPRQTSGNQWFYDPGGVSSDYGTNLNITFTIRTPTIPGGGVLVLNFSPENVPTPFTLGTGDTLWIYDGDDNTAPLIGCYVDQTSPGVVKSVLGNSLTFVLHTNNITTGNGREAGWSAYCQIRSKTPDVYDLSWLGSNNPASPETVFSGTGSPGSCDALFYDSGGSTGNYLPNEDKTVCFKSDVSSYVHAEFMEFDVRDGDILYIYDGDNATTSRLIGAFTGATVTQADYLAGNWGKAPPKDLFSSGYNNARALTFRFTSNSSNQGSGWKVKITCEDEIYHLDANSSACPSVTIYNDLLLPSGIIRVNCSDTTLYRLEADISVSGKYTSDYMIQPIPYNPPFELWEGTQLPMSTDDNWGPPTTLPFYFSFFSKKYNVACPGANGAISFNYHANNESFPWRFDSYDNVSAVPPNSIYGVLDDIDPSYFYPAQGGLPAGSIRYGVMGNYPCRTFVFNFWRVKLFGATTGILDNYNSYQMIIYEGTNIIEVHVRHCNDNLTWPSPDNGQGLIGIQNAERTQFLIPQTPFRGCHYGGAHPPRPRWTVLGENNPAAREAWRFIPVSPVKYDIAWFKNDTNSQPISTVKYAYVSADVTTNFICRIKYEGSSGDTYIVMDTVTLFLPDREISVVATDTVICPQSSTTLSLTHPAAPPSAPQLYDNMSYLWSTGETTPTITVTPGNTAQTYSCTATFSDNCTRTAYKTIQIQSLNIPRIGRNHEDVGDSFSICQGMEAILTADNINLDSNTLNWITVGQGNVPSIIVKPSQTKQYVLEATDTEGCTVRDTITVEVTMPPVAAFTPTPNHVYVENGEGIVYFNNYSQNASSYKWLFGDKYSPETSSTDFEPEHNYTRPGRYTIWLTAVDSSNCRDSVWQTIIVEVPYFLYVPNAFSPDGDGLNETFKPSGYGMDETVYEMTIYNRWGNLIYRTTSPHDSWDGYDRKGKECPTGEYIYIIKTQTLDLVPKEYKGSVLLMR